MNRTVLFLAGLLVLLSTCSCTRGQGCAATLQSHFSVYKSAAITGSTIYTTVSVQGYASVSPSAGCPMGSATHKVGAYNTISTKGG